MIGSLRESEAQRETELGGIVEKDYFVKVFADIAVCLDIVPEGVLELVNTTFDRTAQEPDFSEMRISALYLMQDIEDGCKANCGFCSQSRDSTSDKRQSTLVENLLIRYPLTALCQRISNGLLSDKGIHRICLQTIYNERTKENLVQLVSALNAATDVPITACSIPFRRDDLIDLKDAGVDIVAINYEVATPELFDQIRGESCGGPYRWEEVDSCIEDAVEVFGKGNVGSHLQIGLGESARDALSHVQRLHDTGVFVSLFAFRPVPGTRLQDAEQVSHAKFHKIQLGASLIRRGERRVEDFEFDQDGALVDFGLPYDRLREIVATGSPFRNRGCPGCNRIYYETDPGERFYSFPRPLSQEEIAMIESETLQRPRSDA